MPDFPRTGGSTPTEVWTHPTRTLTAITGTPRINLLGEDADFEAGVGARKARIDAAITTRAAPADILVDPVTDKIDGSNIDAAISSRSSHAPADIWTVASRTITAFTGTPRIDLVGADNAIWAHASRTLTGFTGTPRSDLLGEDATFEAATGRPAKIPRLDNIPAYESAVETSIAMDGTEKTLVEKTDNKIGLLDGYIDLTPMQAGDTIVIRQYMKIKAAGAYVKYAEISYSDAQSEPLLHVTTKTAKTSIKVTAQQTAGTNRTLDVQFFRRLQA
jgi:hypothetical protein